MPNKNLWDSFLHILFIQSIFLRFLQNDSTANPSGVVCGQSPRWVTCVLLCYSVLDVLCFVYIIKSYKLTSLFTHFNPLSNFISFCGPLIVLPSLCTFMHIFIISILFSAFWNLGHVQALNHRSHTYGIMTLQDGQ